MDILLSLLAQPSALPLRDVVEHTFKAVAPAVSEASVQDMLRVVMAPDADNRNAGEGDSDDEALLEDADDEEDENDAEEEEEDEDDAEVDEDDDDAEDDEGDASDDDEEDGDSDEDSDDDGPVDEARAAAIAAALAKSGAAIDSDEEEDPAEDMDDDAMFSIDKLLGQAFKSRREDIKRKKNMVRATRDFKFRVLALLELYARTQPGSPWPRAPRFPSWAPCRRRLRWDAPVHRPRRAHRRRAHQARVPRPRPSQGGRRGARQHGGHLVRARVGDSRRVSSRGGRRRQGLRQTSHRRVPLSSPRSRSCDAARDGRGGRGGQRGGDVGVSRRLGDVPREQNGAVSSRCFSKPPSSGTRARRHAPSPSSRVCSRRAPTPNLRAANSSAWKARQLLANALSLGRRRSPAMAAAAKRRRETIGGAIAVAVAAPRPEPREPRRYGEIAAAVHGGARSTRTRGYAPVRVPRRRHDSQGGNEAVQGAGHAPKGVSARTRACTLLGRRRRRRPPRSPEPPAAAVAVAGRRRMGRKAGRKMGRKAVRAGGSARAPRRRRRGRVAGRSVRRPGAVTPSTRAAKEEAAEGEGAAREGEGDEETRRRRG